MDWDLTGMGLLDTLLRVFVSGVAQISLVSSVVGADREAQDDSSHDKLWAISKKSGASSLSAGSSTSCVSVTMIVEGGSSPSGWSSSASAKLSSSSSSSSSWIL
jgi:hypothetical protein